MSAKSRTRSCIHSVARLPTVVSCAGCRCVYPSVGSDFHRAANAAEDAQHRNHARAQQSEAAVQLNEVAVVRDVRTGRTEMNHAARRRRDFAKRMHMRHHIVPKALFVLGDFGEVDVVEMQSHLGDRRRGNVDAEVAFRFGKREPEAPPEAVARLRRPERQHRRRRVALGERRAVPVVCHLIEKSV